MPAIRGVTTNVTVKSVSTSNRVTSRSAGGGCRAGESSRPVAARFSAARDLPLLGHDGSRGRRSGGGCRPLAAAGMGQPRPARARRPRRLPGRFGVVEVVLRRRLHRSQGYQVSTPFVW